MSTKISVGINKDVIISKAVMNDKDRLVIGLINASKLGDKPVSVFDTLLTAGVQNEGSDEMELQILGPLLPKKEDQKAEQKISLLSSDILRLRNQLTQILEQFMLMDNIDLQNMDVQFANTGITDAETFNARILDQDVLNRIYSNLCNRFITLITPYLRNPEFKLRFKLVRQSKDKHFATIPSRYISDNPFVDLMTVPDEQTKVKFTAYELKEGLNDPTPSSSSSAEKKGGDDTSKVAAPAVVAENPFAAQ